METGLKSFTNNAKDRSPVFPFRNNPETALQNQDRNNCILLMHKTI